MNRRDFTKGLAAAGLAPALPLPSLAKAAPAAMAAKDPMYFWANFVSRVHNNCTPDMFSRLLKLDPGHSTALFNQLIADGAISAPDAYGLSQSTNPLYPEYSRVMGHGKKIAQSLEKPSDNNAVKDALSDQDDPSEDEASTQAEANTDDLETHVEDTVVDETDLENADEDTEDNEGFTSS